MIRFLGLKRCAVLGIAIVVAQAVAAAEQRLTVREDGLARFKVSVTGITRVSIEGDRISDIVNDNDLTVYQAKADDRTGDFFLRYVGDAKMPPKEGGYIVTEKGRTIAYEILPIRATTQTVLISLKANQPRPEEATAAADGFADASPGTGDGLTSQLTEATRQTIYQKIRAPRPSGGANGALISSLRIGDLVGEVRVASAGKAARQVREQEFYKSGVLSVWVQKNSLAAGERSWVVVVRGK
ncbi:type-F conjugative transfer system secretin TraK [Ruegeria sp. HKCCD8929]|uniref:TraK domain-containing protein n=1 Tax=Ruegeria sp. HKCCD8929 TaxID=2683006 RepID=UPI00148998D4|nr:type-F conjugative transfer system secretin TraK [Ruegeria sp. HKCCD8929]